MPNVILTNPLPDPDTNNHGLAYQQSTFPKIVNTSSFNAEIKSDPDWDQQPAKLTGSYDHVKPHCKKDVDSRGAGVICLLCGKRGRDMYNMRVHIEAAHSHLSPGYDCQHCDQEFKSHNCWKVHMKKYHWVPIKECLFNLFSVSTRRLHHFCCRQWSKYLAEVRRKRSSWGGKPF